MAKKYPFTRTISKQTVTALVFDKVHAEPMNKTYTLAEPIPDPARLERKIAKMVETDPNFKLIEVVDSTIEEKCYGLTAEVFMANAVELDPKTRKPIEA